MVVLLFSWLVNQAPAFEISSTQILVLTHVFRIAMVWRHAGTVPFRERGDVAESAVILGVSRGDPLRDYASSMNVESGAATMRGAPMGGASS